MSFSTLGLSSSLLKALAQQKYEKPYPIQEKAIPAILKNKDVLGISKTGSGKTASYVLPILTNLEGSGKVKNRHVDVLVLTPTRELAVQVQEEFKIFSEALVKPVKTLAVYGGASINVQMQAMQGVRILVATPGRLLELLSSNAVHLSNVQTLVLDEADKMLNLGFEEEMKKILSFLPTRRQNLLFSATLSHQVDKITQLLLHKPVVVKVAEEKTEIDLIKQSGYFIENDKKGLLLRYLIKNNNLKQVLVFTSTIYKADRVADKLRKNGIEAKSTHGKKSQKARTDALAEFKSGELRVLVATDLLARGIDIEFLPHVINYELPRSPKDFVHRIGRTGRAESTGEAISFVAPEDTHHFTIIQKKMGKQVTMIEGDSIDLKGY